MAGAMLRSFEALKYIQDENPDGFGSLIFMLEPVLLKVGRIQFLHFLE